MLSSDRQLRSISNSNGMYFVPGNKGHTFLNSSELNFCLPYWHRTDGIARKNVDLVDGEWQQYWFYDIQGPMV